MKHIKKFENDSTQNNINKLENDLLDILDDEIYTEDYYGVNVVSGESKKIASIKIIEYLTKLGIDFNQYFDAKKFNI